MAVYSDHRDRSALVHPADVADKAAVAHVRASGADANNVAGRRDIETNARAHRRVANAVGVVRERTLTNGSVEAAVDVVKERINTVSCVAVAGGVAHERTNTHSRVAVAGVVAREREIASSCVFAAYGIP